MSTHSTHTFREEGDWIRQERQRLFYELTAQGKLPVLDSAQRREIGERLFVEPTKAPTKEEDPWVLWEEECRKL